MNTQNIREITDGQRAFFATEQTLDVSFRKRQLARLEAAVYAWQPEIEQALFQDLGKDATESWMTEIGMVLSEIRYQRRHLEEFARESCVPTPLANFYARSRIVKMPYGTVLVMSPWNYPFLLSMKGAKIYDMDEETVDVKRWSELKNVRAYYEFFKMHEREFG